MSYLIKRTKNRIFLQKLLCFSLLFFPFNIVFAAANDSTQLVSPAVSQTSCTTSYTETKPIPAGTSSVQYWFFNYDKLCPGTYVLYPTCLVSSGDGCGGHRCGWGGHMYQFPVGYSEYAPFFLSTTSCMGSGRTMCENDTAIFYFTPIRLLVPTDGSSQPENWQIDLYVEKLGAYQSCTITAMLTT